jgi:hypothetical protein
MIPAFTYNGLLPPGIHRASVGELRDKLGWSKQRRELIGGLEKVLELMGSCGVERVYLDGSFVTDKDRSGDIDGCYDVPRGANLGAMYPIWPFTWPNRLASKDRFGTEMFPAGAPATASGEPFLSFFQKDRQGRRRGVLLIELAGEAQ